jgi:hypothetical protein
MVALIAVVVGCSDDEPGIDASMPADGSPSLDASATDARVFDAAADDATTPDATVLDAQIDAAMLDAQTSDAGFAGGRILATWNMVRDGAMLTCADMDVTTMWLELTPTSPPGPRVLAGVFPCADHWGTSDVVPLAEYDVHLTLLDGGDVTRIAYASSASVTQDGGLVPVSAVIEFFDEPEAQLQQILDGAAAYYASSPEPKTFPWSTSTTPTYGECCNQGGICDPDPQLWTGEEWTDLGFEVDGRHRFSYSFNSAGSALDATFTARANADFDCDFATRDYELSGTVDADGNVTGSLYMSGSD